MGPFDAHSLRKLQISQYNKIWAEKMGYTPETLNTADPDDKYFWPPAGDRMFPRGEQIFWILNISCEGHSTQRLLQATSLHQLCSGMVDVVWEVNREDDGPAKSYDIYLEGGLLQKPLKAYQFYSSHGKNDRPFDYPVWRQLALCSFFRPGDEINVQLVAKPKHQTSQTGTSEGKPYCDETPSIPNDCYDQCNKCLQTWWPCKRDACHVQNMNRNRIYMQWWLHKSVSCVRTQVI